MSYTFAKHLKHKTDYKITKSTNVLTYIDVIN